MSAAVPGAWRHAGHLPEALRHAAHDLVDGSHVWGTLDQAPARSTVVQQITLRVYRPGTSLLDRRLLHARQCWPVAGAVVVVLVTLALATVANAPTLAVVALAVYAGGFPALEWASREVRSTVRELSASSTCTPSGLVVVGDAACVRATAARLFALDRDLRLGRIDPARHEALWGEVWRAL